MATKNVKRRETDETRRGVGLLLLLPPSLAALVRLEFSLFRDGSGLSCAYFIGSSASPDRLLTSLLAFASVAEQQSQRGNLSEMAVRGGLSALVRAGGA